MYARQNPVPVRLAHCPQIDRHSPKYNLWVCARKKGFLSQAGTSSEFFRKMKQKHAGFTLIELLIVVTIIGVLSAIAIPAYSDYALKTKVSEAGSLLRSARKAIDLAHSEGYALGGMPSQASLGLFSAGSYQSKYVSSVAIDANGVVTASLKNIAELGAAAAGTVVYTPVDRGANLEWSSSCSFGSRLCPRF